jgi:hypothetical protein
MHLCCHEAKQPNLMLKTQPKQLLGYYCVQPLLVKQQCLSDDFIAINDGPEKVAMHFYE